MRLFSCFSGIEAATVALGPLGFETVGLSEVEAFPNAVLEHHYPTVKNYGDITKHREWDLPGSINICVGGPPCQSFSISGLRKGMDDPRGNLSLTYLAFIDRIRPRWIIMENVPGLLSSNKGKDFGSILGALAQLGYGFAYCVLDAQNFGVSQRRRRVFLVGHSGGCWQRPAAVLFNKESVFGDTAQGRQPGQRDPGSTEGGTGECGLPRTTGAIMTTYGGKNYSNHQEVSNGFVIPIHDKKTVYTEKGFSDWINGIGTLRAKGGNCGGGSENLITQRIANPLTARMAKGINTTLDEGQTPVVVNTYEHHPQDSRIKECDRPSLQARAGTGGGNQQQVRRLTPRECERLQGFPDDYTRIPYRGKPADKCPDGPRYKALGNSWAVPVVQWIGQRILEVDALPLDP